MLLFCLSLLECLNAYHCFCTGQQAESFYGFPCAVVSEVCIHTVMLHHHYTWDYGSCLWNEIGNYIAVKIHFSCRPCIFSFFSNCTTVPAHYVKSLGRSWGYIWGLGGYT